MAVCWDGRFITPAAAADIGSVLPRRRRRVDHVRDRTSTSVLHALGVHVRERRRRHRPGEHHHFRAAGHLGLDIGTACGSQHDLRRLRRSQQDCMLVRVDRSARIHATASATIRRRDNPPAQALDRDAVSWNGASMFTTKQYRAKAAEYGELSKGSDDAGQIRKYQDSSDSFSSLADNEEWLADNFDKTLQVIAMRSKPADARSSPRKRSMFFAASAPPSSCSGTPSPRNSNGSSLTPPDRWASCWAQPSCEARSPGFCTSTKTTICDGMRLDSANVPTLRTSGRSLLLAPSAEAALPRNPPRARPAHRESDDKKTRQMMRADIDRVEMQRERQHHHRVLRAGRERDDDIGDRKRKQMRHDQQ